MEAKRLTETEVIEAEDLDSRCDRADREIAYELSAMCQRIVVESKDDFTDIEEQATKSVLVRYGLSIDQYGKWVQEQMALANRQIDSEE
jgi:hypothetical protein